MGGKILDRMMQMGFQNPDDHEYLRTVSQRLGIVFSPPGTGICHFLNIENFVVNAIDEKGIVVPTTAST